MAEVARSRFFGQVRRWFVVDPPLAGGCLFSPSWIYDDYQLT